MFGYLRASVDTPETPANLHLQANLVGASMAPITEWGKLLTPRLGNNGVYSIIRSDGNEKILVLINLTKRTINDYNLSAINTDLQDGQIPLVSLFGTGTFASMNVAGNGFENFKPFEELPPYSIYIFKLND